MANSCHAPLHHQKCPHPATSHPIHPHSLQILQLQANHIPSIHCTSCTSQESTTSRASGKGDGHDVRCRCLGLHPQGRPRKLAEIMQYGKRHRKRSIHWCLMFSKQHRHDLLIFKPQDLIPHPQQYWLHKQGIDDAQLQLTRQV